MTNDRIDIPRAHLSQLYAKFCGAAWSAAAQFQGQRLWLMKSGAVAETNAR